MFALLSVILALLLLVLACALDAMAAADRDNLTRDYAAERAAWLRAHMWESRIARAHDTTVVLDYSAPTPEPFMLDSMLSTLDNEATHCPTHNTVILSPCVACGGPSCPAHACLGVW